MYRQVLRLSCVLTVARALSCPASFSKSRTLQGLMEHLRPQPQPEISYIDNTVAKQVDEMLMTSPGFTIDQLMELAGYSVACATLDFVREHHNAQSSHSKVLVIAGPGNNGGDALVAARHLQHFGINPSILYPKRTKGSLFVNLVKQCEDLEMPVYQEMSPELFATYDLVIDGIFGFSFQGNCDPCECMPRVRYSPVYTLIFVAS
jgi:hydroxyethylthiazole kinase-like uncharacterized protein yjeF